MHEVDSNLVNLNYFSDDAKLESIDKYYNISSKNFNLSKKFFKTNNKISINLEFSDTFKDLNYSNDFFDNKNIEDHNFYIKNIDRNIQNKFEKIEEVILYKDFKPYKKKSIYKSEMTGSIPLDYFVFVAESRSLNYLDWYFC